MVLEIHRALHLADIPYFNYAVISAGNYTVLLGVELYHTDAGLMLAYDCGLVVSKAFAYFCELDLDKGGLTWRSLEQVIRLRSFLDQSRQKIDFWCNPSI